VAPNADGTPGAEATPPLDLEALLGELAGLQGEEALVHAEVSPATVGQVISEWTGIPVGKVLKNEAAAILRFEDELNRRIKGQGHALRALGQRIRQAKAGLQDPTQPLGVFLFVGPSGVGKTETALGLADLLYGGEHSVITVNMSEFQEKHTVSRLIGSPPGYVGFGEGGLLTEAVRKRPYSVVLLDECEKADPEVMNLFYQVFDKGTLSDGEGTEVDFRNTVVILTSNLATAELTSLIEREETPDVEEVVEWIRPVLSRHFKPALLARMTVVPYWPLPTATLREITRLKVRKVADRVRMHHAVEISIDESVIETITGRCTTVETGARNIDHIIRGSLLPVLADWVLGAVGGDPLPPNVLLRATADGRFELGLESPAALEG
jgi:type VI secretion system protein VasG